MSHAARVDDDLDEMMSTAEQKASSEFLQTLGYSPEGAAALIGNFSQEVGIHLPSGYRPTNELDHGSQGLAQWRLDRLTAFQNWCAKQNPPLHTGARTAQLQYVDVELIREYSLLSKALHEPGDINALTSRVCWEYERPNKAQAGLANRQKQAHLTFDAADHVAVRAPQTQARVDATKAKKKVEESNNQAKGAVIAGGILGWAHWGLNMPTPMLIAGGAILAFCLLWALSNSIKANNAAAIATAKAAHPAPSMPPAAIPAAPTSQEQPEKPASDPVPEPPPSDAVPKWEYLPSLGKWIMAWEPPPPPPEPEPPAAPLPEVHIADAQIKMLTAGIVAEIMKQLSIEELAK